MFILSNRSKVNNPSICVAGAGHPMRFGSREKAETRGRDDEVPGYTIYNIYIIYNTNPNIYEYWQVDYIINTSQTMGV